MSVENPVIPTYLALLDAQREAAFAALDGLEPAQLWQRPAPREWCLGEMLNHVYLLNASAMPYVRFAWQALRWYGERRRHKPYRDSCPTSTGLASSPCGPASCGPRGINQASQYH
jgi:hypothetical protein